jgi:hypothetical protein
VKPVRLCPKGHDTSVVGRTAKRYCRECERQGIAQWAKTAEGRASHAESQARYEGTVKGILTQLRRHAQTARREVI